MNFLTQDKVKKVVDIWKKSSTFSSEALKPCYARLAGEVPDANATGRTSQPDRQFPLFISLRSAFVQGNEVVWSAPVNRSAAVNQSILLPLQAACSQLAPTFALRRALQSLLPLKVNRLRCNSMGIQLVAAHYSKCRATHGQVSSISGNTSAKLGAGQTASHIQILVVIQYQTPISVCATEVLNVRLRRYSPLLSSAFSISLQPLPLQFFCFGDYCAPLAVLPPMGIIAGILRMQQPIRPAMSRTHARRSLRRSCVASNMCPSNYPYANLQIHRLHQLIVSGAPPHRTRHRRYLSPYHNSPRNHGARARPSRPILLVKRLKYSRMVQETKRNILLLSWAQ